jgi:putative ABC transport system substrate-binding protein
VIDRRAFLHATAAVLAATRTAAAQPSGKVWRVAMVIIAPSVVTMIRKGLGDLGYVEGQNLVVDHRTADGRPERYPATFAELLALKPDVMIVYGANAIRAAQRATTQVPIVALEFESDPVAAGFVKSLARPGGNITGVFLDMPELAAKQLQFLRETLPGLTRVAVLWDPSIHQAQFQSIEAVARAAGVTVRSLPVQRTEDVEPAVSQAGHERVNALLALTGAVIIANHGQIADLAVKYRLPSISITPIFVEAGGLMSYGPSPVVSQRVVPSYVDRILKGASPAELPVERPRAFELGINVKTAKALGLTVPPSVLLRADRVIE